MSIDQIEATLTDFTSEGDRFREEVIRGLMKEQKQIPSKYLYDARGSQLFNDICETDDYYPTRTEVGIIEHHAGEIASLLGEDTLLIEYGSGSSMKTRRLLDELPDLVAYVPVEISRDQLVEATEALTTAYPDLTILPVCADYTKTFDLPAPPEPVQRRTVYYPGSTIGNFHPPEAIDFLHGIAELIGPGNSLLIGVDLKKEAQILHNAYNDSEGVTAAFNLNLLDRMNRELEATFDVDCFQHYALFNPHESRVEMHIASRKAQTVWIGEDEIQFEAGETIWTESSYKYSLEAFARLAGEAGFAVERVWTDPKQWFAVHYLTVR